MARLNVGVRGLSHDHVWGNLAALRQVASESAVQRERLGPDPTPEQARAHDLAMVLFVPEQAP